MYLLDIILFKGWKLALVFISISPFIVVLFNIIIRVCYEEKLNEKILCCFSYRLLANIQQQKSKHIQKQVQ
jgi:ABC-type multidrug transport system fused ATPase/permease subunit